jgi:hypothetical protein
VIDFFQIDKLDFFTSSDFKIDRSDPSYYTTINGYTFKDSLNFDTIFDFKFSYQNN